MNEKLINGKILLNDGKIDEAIEIFHNLLKES
jgi:hypothetical protein